MNYRLKSLAKKLLFQNALGIKLYKRVAAVVSKHRSSMTDEEYVLNAYQENNGIVLDLKEPKTFNEKLLWISLHDHDPLKTMCADKFRVREFVTEKGYGHILNELYAAYSTVDEIEYHKLPQVFFMKTNHDSGTYALVDQNVPDTVKKAEAIIKKALQKNYYHESREWQYKDIKPLVICEKYIDEADANGLIDYRFFCFGGKVGFVAVDMGTTDASGKHAFDAKRNLYSCDFELLEAKLKRENFDPALVKKPENYEEMVRIAEDLSKPFKHVRVDLYNVNGKIIFGEMTFCNGGGMQRLTPDEFNLEIGKLMDISET